ncbi:anaphase-promoting complex subunit 1 isoform X2 [Salvia miltiorrhiza]|uniref:anaphase-promoting complex subunit 1 isoform X2 n=1 Tax=Salvia miltiorrhiza TaxID=226208 RepID=UPI0025ACCD5D|nr:anaphase-promoting complex subunit 1 isoform X2 [Salvia miltiorrhiza]XP_057804628.1 anaphase-promoting complex subunit 1 isoform X2 [Salvia miltiorrhiza]
MPHCSVRELTVLTEFRPFGLTAEALDGGSPSGDDDNDYHYFLFGPQVAKQRDETAEVEDASSSDHELFVRGNRIIWSAGSKVYKRFTLPSKVIKVCWTRMSDISEALLCVLQVDRLTIYGIAGEVVSVPLPYAVTSIWSLPFGLLLQRASEGSLLTNITLSSSNPFLNARDVFRQKRDSYTPTHMFDYCTRSDGTSMSSHMILKDPLEDPQITYIEERGKLNLMWEFDERTIWTSDCVPLMASYNKGKMQHSLWVVEVNGSNLQVVNPKSCDLISPPLMSAKHFFRRIWQGKGSHTPASKVFLAMDDDVTPIICFLLLEQKKLLSLRLQSLEVNNETIYDIKPDMSWCISAIAAAAVAVTRPKVKVGQLPHRDVIALTPANTLLLYCGKQCLCKYVMPSPFDNAQLSGRADLSGVNNTICDLKIVELSDAVEGRISLVLNNGQNYRCTLRRSPSSSLTDECITAMSEGLNPNLYKHFLGLLWGGDDSTYLAKANLCADSEWESFCNVITKLCQKPNKTSQLSDSVSHSSWEFLVKSKYNQQYLRSNYVTGAFPGLISNLKESDSIASHTQNTEEAFHMKLLTETLDSLHAVYETLKLDNLRKRDLGLLVVILYDIADFLHEPSYLDHYKRDFPGLLKDFGMSQFLFTSKTPPSLFRWLENCLQHGCGSASICDLPLLVCRNGTSIVNWARKIISFYSLLCGAEQSGKSLSTGVTCNIVPGLYHTREELTVLGMVGERFGLHHLDLLPAGVSLPLRHAIDKCRESPPTNWPAAAYVLLGREDLALLHLRDTTKYPELDCTRSNLILGSTPYMLPLHPVTIPSSVSDTLEMDNSKLEDIDNFEGPVIDGMEHIFNSSTQLRYGRDLRLNEVRRLLCSARPVVIQTPVNPTASDQDFQQTQLWHLAQRTTAVPFGRGAFTLGTICTLLTEALAVPKLVLAGRLPAQQNATVNLDPNVRNIQELKSWPEFHNAVAAGLRLSPLQGKMSRTWILYNKPDEPNVTHAGLLLALGLHGHLRVLTITDIFQYYSQEHESTTVGLMIGLAASYRGTMQPSISKSLYVHLPARHPSSFPELELPTLIQSAALISVGLLYEGSAHPQTMQILLSEIGRRSGGDNVHEREGYAVSAGFALGLVALGRGEDAVGSIDTLVDRLFHYIGGKELHNDGLFSSSADEFTRSVGQIVDGNVVNIDVTAPGAIIALALMFLKTESELIVSRLSIPQTKFDLQYIRPDFILLRVIARNLILWTRIQPSENWIQSQIPEVVKHGVSGLGNKMDDVYEMDAEAFVQAYVNIIVGACISLGLRFAGTRDGNAQELLYKYAVYFLNEIKPVCASNANDLPKGLSVYVDRGTLETYLHLIVLSLCVVMAGSGHLQTFRFLKFLRIRNSADGHAGFGTQMAVSLAIGFLFIGGGMWTFSTSNCSIAALLITLYPRLPTGPNDNRCHLQAFRHLYVLATEARWIQTVDVDTGLPVYVPLEITNKETELYAETSFCEVTPCSLPERAILKSVRVCGPRYWPQLIDLSPKEKPWWNSGENHHPFNSGVLYVKRKVGACSYVDDPIGSQSLLSRAMHKMSALNQPKSSLPTTECTDAIPVDQLVSTFSSDPSLIAFAQLFCGSSWSSRFELDFQEFCQQVLFECVSKDRPALLQVYLSLYATMAYIVDSVVGGTCIIGDSLSLSSLKIALAYYEALSNGRLTTSRGEIMQSTFLGSLKKRVEDILNCSTDLNAHIRDYALSGKWPTDHSRVMKSSMALSWYLQWYNVPSPLDIKRAAEKIKCAKASPSVPLLRVVFPTTHVAAIDAINEFLSSSQVEG